jgi:hypothetical protein
MFGFLERWIIILGDCRHAQEQKSENENLIDISTQSDQSKEKLMIWFDRGISILVDENDIQDNGEIIDEETPTKVREYWE